MSCCDTIEPLGQGPIPSDGGVIQRWRAEQRPHVVYIERPSLIKSVSNFWQARTVNEKLIIGVLAFAVVRKL